MTVRPERSRGTGDARVPRLRSARTVCGSIAFFCLTAAATAPVPRVTLFTALPLMWGEGDPGDVLSGRARRSAMLDGLTVRAIDVVSAQTLGRDVLIVAQPRVMAPEELVALDTWVRGGGRAVIYADPRLDWPSIYPLGDRRRAPPVTLLDPLFAHWGVRLDLGEGTAGRWQRGACAAIDAVTIDCRIGKGRALLIADADRLDDRTGADDMLRSDIARLGDGGGNGFESKAAWVVGFAAGLGLIMILLLKLRTRRRT